MRSDGDAQWLYFLRLGTVGHAAGARAKAAEASGDRWERGALYSRFTRTEKYGRHIDCEKCRFCE